MKKEYVEQCLKRYSFGSMEDMYAAVGYGTITAGKIVAKLKEYSKDVNKEEEKPIVSEGSGSKAAPGTNISVKGIDNCLVRVSRCCTPLPGDEIVGFITKGRGVSVHRADCINVKDENLSPDEKARLIECSWNQAPVGKYMCDLQIEATTRRGLLTDVSLGINDYKLPILALNLRTGKNNLAVIDVTTEVLDATQLENLIKRLYTVPGVYNVIRSNR